MPKVTGTRDHNARELFTKLQRGPASIHNTAGCRAEDYNLWVSTWILPQIIDLIPQLRKDPPAFQLMNRSQDTPAALEPPTYELMTVLELKKETITRGLGLMNLRDYKRHELTSVLYADDKKERETVQNRYPDARIERSGAEFVIVDTDGNALTKPHKKRQQAWQQAAEDVRSLIREERHS